MRNLSFSCLLEQLHKKLAKSYLYLLGFAKKQIYRYARCSSRHPLRLKLCHGSESWGFNKDTEPNQISKAILLREQQTAESRQLLISFAKSSKLDVWMGSESASGPDSRQKKFLGFLFKKFCEYTLQKTQASLTENTLCQK